MDTCVANDVAVPRLSRICSRLRCLRPTIARVYKQSTSRVANALRTSHRYRSAQQLFSLSLSSSCFSSSPSSLLPSRSSTSTLLLKSALPASSPPKALSKPPVRQACGALKTTVSHLFHQGRCAHNALSALETAPSESVITSSPSSTSEVCLHSYVALDRLLLIFPFFCALSCEMAASSPCLGLLLPPETNIHRLVLESHDVDMVLCLRTSTQRFFNILAYKTLPVL